jgi:signal transduction histidine kinase
MPSLVRRSFAVLLAAVVVLGDVPAQSAMLVPAPVNAEVFREEALQPGVLFTYFKSLSPRKTTAVVGLTALVAATAFGMVNAPETQRLAANTTPFVFLLVQELFRVRRHPAETQAKRVHTVESLEAQIPYLRHDTQAWKSLPDYLRQATRDSAHSDLSDIKRALEALSNSPLQGIVDAQVALNQLVKPPATPEKIEAAREELDEAMSAEPLDPDWIEDVVRYLSRNARPRNTPEAIETGLRRLVQAMAAPEVLKLDETLQQLSEAHPDEAKQSYWRRIRVTLTVQRHRMNAFWKLIQDGNFRGKPERVSLQDSIALVKEMLDIPVRLEFEDVSTARHVYVDPDHLLGIWQNLFSNARYFNATRIVVRVRRSPPAHLMIEVDDDGPGMPRGIRERIFEAGVSGRGSTGLGLSMVKAIAYDAGGSVDYVTVHAEDLKDTKWLVAAARRGREAIGTTFCIRLPAQRTTITPVYEWGRGIINYVRHGGQLLVMIGVLSLAAVPAKLAAFGAPSPQPNRHLLKAS